MNFMNEKEIKPYIDRLKKDPSLNEILNFTQSFLKKYSHNGKSTEKIESEKGTQLNAEALTSLVTTAQSFINPTTLSLLSTTLSQPEIKEEDSNSFSLEFKVEQLSAELSKVIEDLNEAKVQLAERSQRLEELEATVLYLKRRKRR
jgi:DNA repair ATPase RecN